MSAYALQVLDRAVRTAVQVLVGYFATAQTLGGVDWRTAVGAIALSFAVSLLQGLIDLPSISGLGVWGDILGRAVRTFAQTAAGSIGAAVLIAQVPWATVLSAAGLAALTSIATSLLAMPFGPASVKGTPELAEHPRARPVAA